MNKEILLEASIKALANARDLYDEAEILKESKKFARAYTLFHLSLEEIGKVFIVYKYILINNYEESIMKKFDKEYRSHKTKIDFSKNIEIIATWLIEKEDLTMELIEKTKYSNDQIKTLNNFKNLSLYSFIDGEVVATPNEIFTLEKLSYIKEIAEMQLVISEAFCKVFSKDIDYIISLAIKP